MGWCTVKNKLGHATTVDVTLPWHQVPIFRQVATRVATSVMSALDELLPRAQGGELAENRGHGDGLWVSCGDARSGVLRIELDHHGAEGVHRARQVALPVSPDRLRTVVRTRVVTVSRS